MAVYTRISRSDLNHLLRQYELGDALEFTPIEAGVVNTNYFLTTEAGEFVLTLFEQLGARELPYFLELMAFLARQGIPSAAPVADRNASYLRELKGKPAAIVRRLRGASTRRPSLSQCRAVGRAMADLHLAGRQFTLEREDQHAAPWWRESAARLRDQLSAVDRALLDDELAFQAAHDLNALPSGVIHADLFRDNVLFEGETLSGIIDFYYACRGPYLYDLAITVNDWCSAADASLDPLSSRELLNAYRSRRSTSAHEHEMWPVVLRAAALRWWLARLLAVHFPRAGPLVKTHDPDAFKRILLRRRSEARTLEAIW